MFVTTLVYELHPTTDPKAAKLFRAELVGRRYKEQWEGQPLPRTALWIRHTLEAEETVDDLRGRVGRDVRAAARAVRRAGLTLGVTSAWVHVMGGGTVGLVELGDREDA
jgi:hypothetical protein